ncbi:Flagellin protein FlaA [Chromobacterium vaccinii]|uniref:flagellin N-terminal helical domain-containing protein n=1 Tax=Chromobacterium vaccinii TaxID=1108595 RepID=UPI000695BA36|nr:flagellin [Chromobacterium vaccinii]QND84441.1 Flagellin protein FlaA [Chromobacterium vaccinii]QND89672.1 Flagellin protein FlaA [Chromobacterium vaccinii]
MLSLHTNIAALNTKSNMNSTQGALSTSMTRLGTGLRINSAMDDAAGLQIATRLDAQSRGMNVAMKNAQNGISMLQTAEGALNEVTNILQRMKDLGTEGATATATADDKKAMQAEYDALGKELTNIMKNTSFGGEKLLQGGKLTQELNFQIGAASTESMTLNLKDNMTGLDTALKSVSSKYEVASATPKTDLEKANDAKAEALKKFTAAETAAKGAGGTVDSDAVTAAKAAAGGQDLAAIAGMPAATDANKQAQAEAYAKYYDGYVANASANADVKKAVDAVSAGADAGTEVGDKATIDTISKALDAVGTVRSALGANANRLDHVINNLSNVNNNTLAAKGRIMDTDYANESSTMTAKQMLMQASTSMLKQSGSMSSLAMSLLQ